MDAVSAWMYSALFGLGSGGNPGTFSGSLNPLTLGTPLDALANLSANRTNAYSQQISADQAQISGLSQLQSAVSAFQSAMAGLETQAAISPAQATSSNTAVLTGSAAANATLGTYTVNVTQLAAAQTVTSASVADPNLTVVGSGTLTIQLGTYNSSANTFTAGSATPVSVTVTNGSLNGIASAINSANAGVTANVTQDASGYHLTLTSAATGAANGFRVSVTDSDGNNTDMAGLSQLSYDPTAVAGAGKNLTQTQAAQDAAYTVNGVAATSASNIGAAIGSGLTASLLQTGSANLSVSLNYTALESALQSFVNAYNSAETTVGGLTAPGGRLAGNSTATGFMTDLGSNIYKNFASSSPYTNLAQIGITANTDGTLALDTAALQTAFNTNPTSVASLVTQAAQNFDTVATPLIQTSGTIPNALQNLQSDVTFLQSLDNGAMLTDTTISQAEAALRYQLALQLSHDGLFGQLFNTGGGSSSGTSLFG